MGWVGRWADEQVGEDQLVSQQARQSASQPVSQSASQSSNAFIVILKCAHFNTKREVSLTYTTLPAARSLSEGAATDNQLKQLVIIAHAPAEVDFNTVVV